MTEKISSASEASGFSRVASSKIKSKTKTIFVCSSCGGESSQWQGQCRDCGEWNTYTQFALGATKHNLKASPRFADYTGYGGEQSDGVLDLEAIPEEKLARLSSTLSELDRALGGGIVRGSVNLIGGDPGIGKSTLLLQVVCGLSQTVRVLYITGEESLQQVSLRAKRLGLQAPKLRLYAETCIELILLQIQKEQPDILVIDSIQTMYTEQVPSAPGSVSQVRESAAGLVRYAKKTHTALFLVGHVTKEGSLAGPRVLEHMVDCVLYFESQNDSRYRVIRAVKNRFGAVNELGVFAMTDRGLKEISNPSAIFLANDLSLEKPGSCVMVTWEGTRPLLVEIQALVDNAHTPNPRRVCVGFEPNRLALLLAVMHRHCGVTTYDMDVFVNIVGGMKISETAIDLPILLAILSSLKNKPLDKHLIAFGEVGLSGEIRPVQSGQERILEAVKQGFKKMIVPHQNKPKKNLVINTNTNPGEAIEILGVGHLEEVVSLLWR